MKANNEHLRYPIGRYQEPETYTLQLVREWIAAIEALPDQLAACIENLTPDELQRSYREGGWTIQQVVHHIADVHLNAYIRLKLALTEDNPVVKPYDENLWAALPDNKTTPASTSITLLRGLHSRWAASLYNMQRSDWERTYYHPERKENISLWEMIALYAWHGRHHLAQIKICMHDK